MSYENYMGRWCVEIDEDDIVGHKDPDVVRAGGIAFIVRNSGEASSQPGYGKVLRLISSADLLRDAMDPDVLIEIADCIERKFPFCAELLRIKAKKEQKAIGKAGV